MLQTFLRSVINKSKVFRQQTSKYVSIIGVLWIKNLLTYKNSSTNVDKDKPALPQESPFNFTN